MLTRRIHSCHGQQGRAAGEQRHPGQGEGDRPRGEELEDGQGAHEQRDQCSGRACDPRSQKCPVEQQRQRQNPDHGDDSYEAEVVDRPGSREHGLHEHCPEGPALGDGRVQHALGVRRRRQSQLLRLRQVQVVVGEPVRSDEHRQVCHEDRKCEEQYDCRRVRYEPAQSRLPLFRRPDEPVEVHYRPFRD